LSLKDATIAELQRKLAAVQSGAPGATSGKVNAGAKPVAAASTAVKKPTAQPATPWYMRPVAWVIAGAIVLLLIALGLSGRRRRPALEGPSRGPLADPDDVSPQATAEPFVDEQEVVVTPSEPEPVDAHPQPVEPETVAEEDPYGLAALREPATAAIEPLPPQDMAPADATPAPSAPAPADEDAYADDPVDTKLDLARAYLDMGDPVGARAMLEEVLEEGTQAQKDEAKRLLAGAEA
jgi:FimV-like protein